MHFDRYAVFHNDAFLECHFGFFGHSQEIMQGLIIVVPMGTLAELKGSFLKYIERIGDLPESTDLPACRLRPPCDVIPVDSIGLARHGKLGEIIFHVTSWKVAVELGRSAETKKELSAICVAMLRCTPELQKRWVLELYDIAKDED